jgi:hypothetical protein
VPGSPRPATRRQLHAVDIAGGRQTAPRDAG